MKAQMAYAPEGVYAEGPLYWNYGTSYEVLMLAALEGVFGESFGLADAEGFLQSARVQQYCRSASSKYFNYSDCDEDAPPYMVSMPWFAKKTGDHSLLYPERLALEGEGRDGTPNARFTPFFLIHAAGLDISKAAPPKEKLAVFDGECPLIIVRDDWSGGGLYLAAKGGKAAVNHGQADAGSFVFESGRTRWALDLGRHDYPKINRGTGGKGLSTGQNGTRWGKLFRYSNFAHNTITVDDGVHMVDAAVKLLETVDDEREAGGVLDLSPLFGGKLKSALRRVSVLDWKCAQTLDRFEAADGRVKISWRMCTGADAEVLDANTIRLRQDGKELLVVAECGKPLEARAFPATPQHFDWEDKNEGKSMLEFSLNLEPRETCALQVRLIPQD